MSLSAPWTTRSRTAGIESIRTFVPPSFGMACRRFRSGRYLKVTSSSRSCARKASTPASSIDSNVTPSIPGGAVVGFRQRVRGAERFQFADVNVQAPEAPRRFSLRLDVYLSSQVPQRHGRLCHLAPASRLSKDGHTVGPLCSTGVTPRPRSYGPIRHPLVFRRFPGSQLYGVPCSAPFRDGTRRASPVASRVLVTVLPLRPRRSEPTP